jgi:hypothetical protein
VSVRIEEFVAHLGWEVDASELEGFNESLKDTVAFFAKIAAAVAGATVALAAFTVATNRQTSIQTQLAEAYDISAESAENWGFLLGAIGFDMNNVVRSAKDLSVRLGQAFAGIGDAATMKDAVHSLGLEFESLRNQKPEEQFKTILQAAKDLDDSQVALAASQQLLGRQGSTITGFLRDQEGTIEELLEAQGKFNFLTQENREQATRFTALMDNVGAVTDSVKASFAAFLSEALAPLAKEFLEWVKANRELIKIKIAEWADRIGRFMAAVFRTMRWGLLALDSLIDKFGGLQNILAVLTGMFAGFALVKIINLFMRFGPLVLAAVSAVKKLTVASALLGAKWILAAGAIALAGLAINSLVRFFQGKDSLVGDIGEKIALGMHSAELAVLEFFGLSKDEARLFKEGMDLTFTRAVYDIGQNADAAWEHWLGFLTELNTANWGEWAEIWKDVWRGFVNWLGGLWGNFAGWFKVNVADVMMTTVQNAVQGAMILLRKIPLVGGFFKTSEGPDSHLAEIQSSVASATQGVGLRATNQQLPSLGVLQTINQTRELLNTANNISRSSSPTVNVTNNITQQPGESGESLARRIQGSIHEELSRAVRDNDSGVRY